MDDLYDRAGDPIDMVTWADLRRDPGYRRIARTMIMSAADPSRCYDVSTIWLGLDHSFTGDGPPVIFETIVFGEDQQVRELERYTTEPAARRGHADLVTVVSATLDDPVVMTPP